MEIRLLTPEHVDSPEFRRSLVHYLRKSRDEMLVEELEAVMAIAAHQERPDLMALGAFDGDRMLGWCLLTVRPAAAQVGSEVVVWAVYVFPDRARLRDLVEAAMPYIEAYARGAGSSRLVMHTRRVSRAYIEMLKGMGWEVHSICMTRGVSHA